MIRFSYHNDFLELGLDSQEEADLPSRGDAYLTIRVSSAGFAGHNDLWVSGECLRKFCADLVALERNRRGAASIESVLPEELKVTVRSINSRGHMAVEGHTGYEVQREDFRYPHAVHFGFEFDPSQLVAAVSVEWIERNSH